MEGEDLAKALFLRLDPILRLLSATIQRYKQLEEDGNEKGKTQDDDQQFSLEEKMIAMLKSQLKLLDALMSDLNNVISGPDDSVALGQIIVYVLLPLQAILKSYNTTTHVLSRQSHLWQCQQGAANVLALVLKLCPSSSISSERKLQLLMICSVALNATEEKSSQDKLDRGEEHAKAMLRCLQTLIDGIPGDQISSALEGNLLVSLVVACVHIVSPPQGDLNRQDADLVMEALIAMGALLDKVPNQAQWRALFPGCSAALLRRILARGGKAARITASSVERLAQLLTATMKAEEERNTSKDVIEQLSQLSFKQHNVEEAGVDAFVQECNNRLPAPLTVLVNVLPTAKSAQVRISTVSLCKTLLTDTWSIWTEEKSIEKHALQCCIILMDDEDDEVRDIARQTLESFKTSDQWSESEFVSTVLDIIAELPIFTRSQRVVELQSKLKLAKGYLELCMNDSSAAAIGETATAPEEVSNIRSSLSSLFDVDFESIQPSPRITSVTTQFGSSNGTLPARYRFIRDDTVTSAKDLVRTLGRALGSKKACLFVDACIADLHESCIAREATGLVGLSQVSWVHEWIGVTVVAEQVLVGLTEGNYATVKEQRKTRKRVKALAAALLPLITASPLWTLPSVHEAANAGAQLTGTLHISAEALRGNAAMLCSLLNFIGTLVDILESDIAASSPVLLYPLFEKAGIHNHSRVQSTALGVIGNIAKSTGLETIEDLVSSNFDYLFGAIQSKLWLFAGTVFDRDRPLGYIPSIAKAILSSGMKNSSDEKEMAMHRSLATRNNATVIIKTAKDITTLFDRRVVHVQKSQDVEPLLDLIEFYDGSLLYLIDSFGLTPGKIEGTKISSDIPTEPWFDLLEPFRHQHSNGAVKGEDGMDMAGTDDDQKDSIDISSYELQYLTLILSRCGYLISHPSLIVRVASCKVQSLAFAFLNFVAEHYVKGEDDEGSEDPGNAIFRQISDSWPAIISRLGALSREFSDSQRSRGLSLHISNALPAPDSSSNLLFLSTLFDLVGAMSSASGSFIWGRLDDEVWPICARILETLLNGRSRILAMVTDSNAPLTEKDKLFLSLLGFYKKVFSTAELAQKAASTISSIGTMILPFIADQDPIGETAMETMKTMLSIDSDALWRALSSTCGEGLPPNPYELLRSDVEVAIALESGERSLLQTRARGLIDFANKLPEQNLEL